MCGRFSQAGDFEKIRQDCKVAESNIDITPRYNIAPSQPAQVIFNESGSKCVMMKWGLVPLWAKNPNVTNRLVNIRADSLKEKQKSLYKTHRCLIPVDGFYEWAKNKQPFRLLMKDDSPFALAGLWSRWNSPDGSPLETFAIITTDANELIAPIHNRMPVIVDSKDYLLWLTDVKNISLLDPILRPFQSEKMRCYKVSHRVNNPRFDCPDCLKPLESDDNNMELKF